MKLKDMILGLLYNNPDSEIFNLCIYEHTHHLQPKKISTLQNLKEFVSLDSIVIKDTCFYHCGIDRLKKAHMDFLNSFGYLGVGSLEDTTEYTGNEILEIIDELEQEHPHLFI